jgi:hypothetical protein
MNDYAPLVRSYKSNAMREEQSNPYNVPNNYYTKLALREQNKCPSKVANEYFSIINIKRIQKLIKHYIYVISHKKFKLLEDQNVLDLLQVMIHIYNDYGKDLPTNIVRQVKTLNKYTIKYIIPDMISNLKQYYGYLHEINNPIKPIDLPLNVNNAGRLQLPGSAQIYK